MEKKKIKLSLAAAVCITIIVILIIALGCMDYITKHKNNEQEAATIKENVINVNNIPEETTKKSEFLSSAEIQEILGPEGAMFCIENIEKSGDEYIITAYMLEKEYRVITKAEYEKLLNGGEIEFRKLKWKKDDSSEFKNEDYIIIKSGDSRLAIDYKEGKGAIYNIAGAKEYLEDYSSQKIKFKVSKNIQIKAGYAGENELISFDRLLKLSEGCNGSYEECKASVKEGKVEAIHIFTWDVETEKDDDSKQENAQTEKNAQNDNSKNIIMYNNINIANAKPNLYYWYFDSKKYPDYYNTTYDIYENGKKIGTTKGKVKLMEDEEYEGGIKWYYIYYEKYAQDDGLASGNKIFVSCNYNVIPRNYEDVTNIPEKIKNDFILSNNIQMQSIDLDGDGNKEYVVIYSEKQSDPVDQYDKGTEEKGVYLYDSNYERISMIAIQKDVQTGYPSHVANFENIEYIDIDNDGEMEIILLIPEAGGEGYRFGIYKYEENGIVGPVDIYSIAP